MKKIAVAAVAAALAMSLGALGGCSTAKSSSSTLDGQPAPMPANHNGRYMDLGEDGCYGCHGANAKANPQLVGAVVIPEDHYAQGIYATMAINPSYNQCITCHPQG